MVAGSAAGMGGGDAECSGAGFEQGLEHARSLAASLMIRPSRVMVPVSWPGSMPGGLEGGVAGDVFDDEDPYLVAPASCCTAGLGSVIWTPSPPSGRAWSSRRPL
jgi:hypothetical protein